MCIYSLLMTARVQDAIQLDCWHLKLYMHICISYSFVGVQGTKCLLIDTFIYYIAMHNTVYKSSRLPVSAFIQANIRPTHYPKLTKRTIQRSMYLHGKEISFPLYECHGSCQK